MAKGLNIYNVARPLSGKALKQLVNQLVGLQVNPQVRAINRSIGQTRRQGQMLSQRTGAYYGQLGQNYATAQAGAQSSSQQLAGQLAGIGNDTMQQLDQIEANRRAQMAADASTRGQGLQGGAETQLAQQQAQARSNAAAQGQLLQGLGAAQGSNYEGLIRAMTGSAAMAGGQAQTDITNRQQNAVNDFIAKRSDVNSQAGGLRAQYVQQLRDSEFNKLITAQTLGLNQAKLDAQVAQNRAQNRIASATLGLRASSQAETARHNQANELLSSSRIDATLRGQNLSHKDRVADRRLREKLKASGVGGLTPNELRTLHEKNAKTRSQIRAGAQAFDYLLNPKTNKGTTKKDGTKIPPLTVGDVKYILGKRFSGDADLVNAAFDIYKYGTLSVESEQALRARHIGIPERWVRGAGIPHNKI